MVTMMVRRKGGGEEGGIDGKWGEEDGREHRSLVVRNGEQGGGEKTSRRLGGTCCPLSSPWWAMMIFGVEALVWMMFLSLPQSHPLLHLPVSDLLLQIQKVFLFLWKVGEASIAL